MPCGVAAVLDSGLVVGEVNGEGEELLVARGGKGSKREAASEGQVKARSYSKRISSVVLLFYCLHTA